jgi:hypothetical protein
VKNSKNTDRAADKAGISSDVDDRLGRRLHQHGITVTLIGAQEGAQVLRYGDGDVKVVARQHLGFAPREPGLGLVSVALAAASVFAGMIGEDFMPAVTATPD